MFIATDKIKSAIVIEELTNRRAWCSLIFILDNKEMDKDFKDMVFNAFSSKMQNIHYDEDGLIVVHVPVQKKATNNPSEDNQ